MMLFESSKESAEKICGLIRKREELDEVLKDKLAKRKEAKSTKIEIPFSNTMPEMHTITYMISRLTR